MTFKSAFIFVAQCIVLKHRSENHAVVKKQLVNNQVDWRKVIWIASNEMVFPSLYLQLKQNSLLDYIPDTIENYLQSVYLLNKSRNELIMKQVVSVNNYLLKHKISPIFMKGVGCLADGLYSDIGERMIGDIDVLVPDSEFFATIKLLKKKDYYCNEPLIELPIQYIKHYPRLMNKKKIAAIEVHRVPVNLQYVKKLSGQEMVSQSIKSKFPPFCSVPNDIHKLLQNYIHSQLSNGGNKYGKLFLRDVIDFFLLKQRIHINSDCLLHPVFSKIERYNRIINELIYGNITWFKKDGSCFILRLRLIINLKYRYWSTINCLIIYLCDRASMYFRIFYLGLINNQIRQKIVVCLTKKAWYRSHFYSYTVFFRKIRS